MWPGCRALRGVTGYQNAKEASCGEELRLLVGGAGESWRGEHKNLCLTLPLSHLLPIISIDQTQLETSKQVGASFVGTQQDGEVYRGCGGTQGSYLAQGLLQLPR